MDGYIDNNPLVRHHRLTNKVPRVVGQRSTVDLQIQSIANAIGYPSELNNKTLFTKTHHT